jgi:hypothetical protein
VVKERHSKACITELSLTQGGTTTDPSTMLNACHEFYSSLYAAPDQGDADSMLLDSIMNLVPRKVTAEMNERLCEPISLEEL